MNVVNISVGEELSLNNTNVDIKWIRNQWPNHGSWDIKMDEVLDMDNKSKEQKIEKKEPFLWRNTVL